MKQLTLAAVGFERYAKTTRRAAFLAEMERVVPWSALCALIEPFYPKPGNGRPPVGIERILRIYFLQQWFNLSDPAVEEALYDSSAMRRLVDIDLGREHAGRGRRAAADRRFSRRCPARPARPGVAAAVYAGCGGQRPRGLAGVLVGGRGFTAPWSAPALDG